MIDLHYQFRIGRSTLSKTIRTVCKAIWNTLKQECIPQFSEEMWLRNAAVFKERSKFPNCLGALDGKHVRVVKPEFSGS